MKRYFPVMIGILVLLAILAFGQTRGGGSSSGGTSLACAGTPGNTTGAYRSQCQTAAGALYTCNNSGGCTASGDWVAVAGSVSGLMGSGTYASLPATCSVPFLYVFTDTQYSQAYCSATNAYTFIEPFLGSVIPPATLTMAWANQTSATVDTTYGYAILSAVNNGGSAHKWKLRTASITTPANPYTMTMWFQPANLLGNGQANDRYGLVIYDAAGTGKFIDVDFNSFTNTSIHISVNEWTNFTTFSTQLFDSGLTSTIFPSSTVTKWGLRIQNDGTNVLYSWSMNGGSTWNQVLSHAKNTFVTPDTVAFGFDAFDANLVMQVDSFRLTQP